jgi:hypothetical protein
MELTLGGILSVEGFDFCHVASLYPRTGDEPCV